MEFGKSVCVFKPLGDLNFGLLSVQFGSRLKALCLSRLSLWLISI